MSSLRNRWLGIGFVVALTILSTAASAVAEEVTYAIVGIETGFDATSSAFVGTGLADDGDFAFWEAVVLRTPFDANRNALITGGTIRLDGGVRDLQGVIVEGTITSRNKNCRRESFVIQGTLSLVDGQGQPTGGTGQFVATLIHYGRRVNGQCITFFATVDGSVAFTLP